ncbi:uncharacterized protein LOC134274286 [Saccostrea cucullata]|uniref:uncharacterized protein LOC134274286 n=1 Tax=Saccostrea cuccullata TaxID=36930 RepID=UPI002ED480EC
MRIIKRCYQSASFHKNLHILLRFSTYPPSNISYSVQKSLHQDMKNIGTCSKKSSTSLDLECTAQSIHTQSKNDIEPWEAMVDYSKLSPLELKIHQRHVAAHQAGKLFYVDPQTGYQVMTRLSHLQRGECCGNECRHCPYGRKNVPDDKRRKKFNTAFYV